MARVLLIDGSTIFRQGLKHIVAEEFPGLRFCEVTQNEGLTSTRIQADIIVFGANLASQTGLDALLETRNHYPQARILVLDSPPDRRHATHAVRIGALGYISRDASRSDLIAAFRNVLSGRQYVSESIGQGSSVVISADSVLPIRRLSSREEAVMRRLVAGERSRDIAIDLNVSVKTVGTFKRRVHEKLGLKSTAELVRYCIDHSALDGHE